jgi:hypothetical protein
MTGQAEGDASMRRRSAGRAWWASAVAGLPLLVLLTCMQAQAQPTPGSVLTPEQTVNGYLAALKAGDFSRAYDYISKGMAQNKDRAAWAKEQQWTMQMSDAKIFDYHVYPGKIEGDKAYVPNLLSSQDKFLNQLGVAEHELYTLVRQDGRWKIDQQQLLERSDQGKWFPTPAAK